MEHLCKIIFLFCVQILQNCSSTEYTYLGCYFLNSSLETSGLPPHRDPLLTYQRCLVKCTRHLQSFFLVYNEYCVCSQTISNYTRLEPGVYCDTPCPGAKRRNCGGRSAVNIFAVTYCRILSKPANGLVEQSTEEATFVCLSGYQLQGSPVIHCNKTLSEWDGPTQPLCVKGNCTAPKRATDNLKTEAFISPSGSTTLVMAVILLAVILLIREICHRKRNNILTVNLPSTHQPADPDNTVQLYSVTKKVRNPQMDVNDTLGNNESKRTEGHIPDWNYNINSASSESINNKRNTVVDGMVMENNTEGVTSSCSYMPAKRKNSSSCQSVQSSQDDSISITDDESEKSDENKFANFLKLRKQISKGAHKFEIGNFDLVGSSGGSIVHRQDEMDTMTDDEDDKEDDCPTMYGKRGSNEMDNKKRADVDTYGIPIEDNTEF